MLARFRRFYGAHVLHLLVLLACFAVFGYVVATIQPVTLWNSQKWWQSIAVWFAAAIIAHDLVLFPLYALADRVLAAVAPTRALNYLRVPTLGSGLLLLVYLPGIIRQGGDTYLAATGQTQEPFLGRWLLISAAMFVLSALVYAATRPRRPTRSRVVERPRQLRAEPADRRA
ncbi:hypothetical protein FOS14_11660 [Skermania sp. ID1734]|nr:hypothetical protein [Skermania sp. ID1734]TSD99574.1 hypothetical protein FOS14_11660 [Skermania sp. ID1734]